MINESQKQTFDEKQKFKIHLNNGKAIIRHAKSRYDAHHNGLSTSQKIIGVKRIEHLGASSIEEGKSMKTFKEFLDEATNKNTCMHPKERQKTQMVQTWAYGKDSKNQREQVTKCGRCGRELNRKVVGTFNDKGSDYGH